MSDNSKVQKLRSLMNEQKIDFLFVPSTDEHNNEYVPEHLQYRSWISDFDGSAGDVLVGINEAFLSTDGRYFLQAKQQLDNDIFVLLKQSGYASEINSWLINNASNKVLAIDPKSISCEKALYLKNLMSEINGKLVFTDDNLVGKAMLSFDKNIISLNKNNLIKLHDYKFSGENTSSKIKNIRSQMTSVDACVFSVLDEIAWILNIRGSDIDFNPLVISYLIITKSKCHFFVDSNKIDNSVKKYFSDNNVDLHEYNSFFNFLNQMNGSVSIDGKTANYAIEKSLKNSKITFKTSPAVLPKACKNKTEIDCSKNAHKKDAAALVKFMHWLENNWQDNIDEMASQEKLDLFRAEQENYQGQSFSTISGFAENGAVIHYRAAPKTAKQINDRHLYLLDSGGQYSEGTTDITRTFHLGKPTPEEKKYYTLVLKGHLALTRAIFPEGTKGAQLDILARQYLWNNCDNYAHGTGHGVGSYMCVHEGPQGISPGSWVQPLIDGMILSNEPGVYFENKFGIRIENLFFVKTIKDGAQKYYGFEDLTLVPYAKNLIDVSILNKEEIDQINKYHKLILSEISPLLPSDLYDFICEKTSPIM